MRHSAILIAFMALLLCMPACDDELAWVVFSPVQCKEEVWSTQWREDHPGEAWPGWETVLISYFEGEGLPIYEVKVHVYAEVVIALCGAGTGESIYCHVDEANVPAFESYGLKEVEGQP